jgi:DNA polymerase III sliding clamp (beta) subunit (PCNA family)
MLNKHNLSIANLTSKDASRYALGGILVSPKRTAATDGHCLMVVDTPELSVQDFPAVDGVTPADDFTPFILPRDEALNLAKSLPKKTALPILRSAAVCRESDANGQAVFATSDMTSAQVFRPKKLEGTFPNIDMLIPDADKATLKIQFNPNLLISVLKELAPMAGDRLPYVTLSFTDKCSPVRIDVTSEQGQHAIAVIMPMNIK